MDERAIKRLVVTLIVAIGIILLAKSMLSKTYTNLNKAVAIKKLAVQPPANVQIESTPTAAVMLSASGVGASSSPTGYNSNQGKTE